VAVSSAAVFYLAKRVIPSAAVSHLAMVAVSSDAVFYLANADIPAAAVFCAAALRAAPPSPPSSSQRPTTCGEASFHVSKRSFNL
jgi:hypothetical protein